PPPPPPPPPPPEPEPEPEPILPLEVEVNIWPQPFSPDGDGVDDELTIEIATSGTVPVTSWHIIIREPVAPHHPFYERYGEGEVPEAITWDGIGTAGEVVQSAMDYPIEIIITNADGEVVAYESYVRIDVLVRREEGGILRVIVPSIIFGPNLGTFAGLDPEVMENNDRVLRRIAEILNRFDEYEILVEGHANPTTPPGTALRAEEETGSHRMLGLQPLSEERAGTVLEYLVSLGVYRGRLSSVGMGGSRILVEFEDRDYWWQNRRVEFILIR
ncbi:MAG: OmpA family protein, partial [Treponema sp.]|nr:OmpA family protein [Treponema sp.]